MNVEVDKIIRKFERHEETLEDANRLKAYVDQGDTKAALIHSTADRETDALKQKELEAEYDVQVSRLKELGRQKEEANDKRNRISALISSLRDKGNAITEFDEELFNVMVRQAVVSRDGSIEFEFNSGYKVKIEAGE